MKPIITLGLKRLVETIEEEWILTRVHILHMVGNADPFGHNLLPWCRGGCWAVQVVDNNLPSSAHLLCSCLGHSSLLFPIAGQKTLRDAMTSNSLLDVCECTYGCTCLCYVLYHYIAYMHYYVAAFISKGNFPLDKKSNLELCKLFCSINKQINNFF